MTCHCIYRERAHLYVISHFHLLFLVQAHILLLAFCLCSVSFTLQCVRVRAQCSCCAHQRQHITPPQPNVCVYIVSLILFPCSTWLKRRDENKPWKSETGSEWWEWEKNWTTTIRVGKWKKTQQHTAKNNDQRNQANKTYRQRHNTTTIFKTNRTCAHHSSMQYLNACKEVNERKKICTNNNDDDNNKKWTQSQWKMLELKI